MKSLTHFKEELTLTSMRLISVNEEIGLKIKEAEKLYQEELRLRREINELEK